MLGLFEQMLHLPEDFEDPAFARCYNTALHEMMQSKETEVCLTSPHQSYIFPDVKEKRISVSGSCSEVRRRLI